MKIGIFGILGISFIILKLVGTIAWSWWWVLAPFWVPVLIGLLLECVKYWIFFRRINKR